MTLTSELLEEQNSLAVDEVDTKLVAIVSDVKI